MPSNHIRGAFYVLNTFACYAHFSYVSVLACIHSLLFITFLHVFGHFVSPGLIVHHEMLGRSQLFKNIVLITSNLKKQKNYRSVSAILIGLKVRRKQITEKI